MILWVKNYLDITYTIILQYLDSIRTDVIVHKYGELVEYIKEVAGNDDGAIYKIYDNYSSEKIIKDEKITIVLTTIHKVKGLEFDAVIVPPSEREFPYCSNLEEDVSTNDFSALLHEERRLYYVAYTRAKKLLCAYIGNRELAIKQGEVYQPQLDDSTYINFEPTILSIPCAISCSL